MQNAAEDSFLETTFKTLADDAKRPLTRRRTGLLVAGFESLDGDQLLRVAEQDQDPRQGADRHRRRGQQIPGVEEPRPCRAAHKAVASSRSASAERTPPVNAPFRTSRSARRARPGPGALPTANE